MANVEIGTIISSMSVDLNKRIVELDKKVDKLKDGLQEKSILDKIFVNRDINGYIKEERSLTKLLHLLFDIRNNKKYKTVITDEAKENIEVLCSMLNDKEVEHFKRLLNGCLKKERDLRVKEIRGNIAQAKGIVNQLLDNKKFSVESDLDKYEGMLYSAGIDEVDKEFKKKDLIPVINYNRRSEDDFISFAEQRLLSEVREMNQFGELKYDVSTTAIVENLASIRNAFVARTRINSILRGITAVNGDFNKMEDFGAMEVKNYLTKLEIKYLRELEKVTAYLSKFDFTSVMMQVENRKSRIDFLEELRNNMSLYEEMSYQLEKVSNENPEDVQTIIILNQKMSAFTTSGVLNSTQLEKACKDGIDRYRIERKLMDDMNGGQQILNDYLVYFRTTKDSTKMSLPEYAKKYHSMDIVEASAVEEKNDTGMKK